MLVLGCGGNIVLDNPGNDAVVFTFDEKDKFEVPAHGMQTISLEAGDHKVVVKSMVGAVLADTSFRLAEGREGLVHSGASEYLVWRQLYGLQKDRKTLLNERWVEFDSIKAFGDIKVYPESWLFIEKSWDLGLADDLPESKNLYITKDFEIESKIFRAKEFVKTYKGMARRSK